MSEERRCGISKPAALSVSAVVTSSCRNPMPPVSESYGELNTEAWLDPVVVVLDVELGELCLGRLPVFGQAAEAFEVALPIGAG